MGYSATHIRFMLFFLSLNIGNIYNEIIFASNSIESECDAELILVTFFYRETGAEKMQVEACHTHIVQITDLVSSHLPFVSLFKDESRPSLVILFHLSLSFRIDFLIAHDFPLQFE